MFGIEKLLETHYKAGNQIDERMMLAHELHGMSLHYFFYLKTVIILMAI